MQIKRLCKNVFIVLLALLMLLSLAVIAMPVYAVDVNGHQEREQVPSGDPDNYRKGGLWWTVNNEQGMRVTVVDKNGNRISDPIDYCAYDKITTPEYSKITLSYAYHFGQICKTDYRKNGYTISSVSNVKYKYSEPPAAGMPRLTNGDSYETLVNYFREETVINTFLKDAGVDSKNMVNNNYRILVEPIIYLTRVNDEGYWDLYAFTPTELGMFVYLNKFTYNNTLLNNKALRAWTMPTSLLEPDIGYGTFAGCSNYSNFKNGGNSGMSNEDYQTIYDYLGMWVIKVDDLPITTPKILKVYYHLYDSSDKQTMCVWATNFDLGTSTTKQFQPVDTYGTPVAACVEKGAPTTTYYPLNNWWACSIGNPSSKSKLSGSLTVTSEYAEKNYTIHVKVIDAAPPPATVKVPVYYYYYDGYGNQTSCSSSVESYVELNKTNWRYF